MLASGSKIYPLLSDFAITDFKETLGATLAELSLILLFSLSTLAVSCFFAGQGQGAFANLARKWLQWHACGWESLGLVRGWWGLAGRV